MPSSLERIWARLGDQVSGAEAVPALTGLPAAEMADLAELAIAHSHEAHVFLDLLASTVRQFQSTTLMETERCVGQVRGPIMWSETITAWSTGLGADDVFVCMAPRRHYDLAENRVVAWLLWRLGRASRHLDTAASMRLDEGARHEVARNSAVAKRWLRHRFLVEVEHRRPRSADLRRARATRHPRPYEPAFALLDRTVRPFHADEVVDLVDPATDARLAAFSHIIDAVEAHGIAVPALGVHRGAVGSGRLVFRHQRLFGRDVAGIELNGVMIDAPLSLSTDDVAAATAALAKRSGDRPWCLVANRNEAELAVEMAMDLSRGA